MSFEWGDQFTDLVSECCDSRVTLTGFCQRCGEHAMGYGQSGAEEAMEEIKEETIRSLFDESF